MGDFYFGHRSNCWWRQPATSRLCGLFLLCAISLPATAQTITGVVTNSTTNTPAAGDEVILIKLAQGMDEVARAKTDARGGFTLKGDDPRAPYLIRAIHQGVPYHRMAPPGTTSVDMQVFDVARKIEELKVTADVIRLQAESGSLLATRRFALDNSSNPPRTQMNDQNFEFYLPDGAQIDSGMAKTANGQPVNSAPVPEKEKNRYAFIFPLRPGQTEFQVGFHMPYNGSATIDPKPIYAAEHFVVMLPKSMHFTSQSGSSFQSVQDPSQSSALVQIATNTQAGQSLAFRISGTGTLPASGGSATGGAQAGAVMANSGSSPGGGLGSPESEPDPLQSYRWFILGGFAIVLAAMAIFVYRRPRIATATGVAAPAVDTPATLAVFTPTSQAEPDARPAVRSGLLFEALKDELFQLEVEHKQGGLSDEEYAKARAALEQTLERAVKRDMKS